MTDTPSALTERAAYDAACIRAGHDLVAANDINDDLSYFASKVLLGRLKRPEGNAGPRKLGRYSCAHQTIVLAIYIAIEHGFCATRSGANDLNVCAIDIVGEAMIALRKRPAGFDRLKDIWEDRVLR